MRRLACFALAFILSSACAAAQDGERVRIDAFAIDRTETTIAAFERFAAARGLVTEAERAGGGFEFAQGWTRRPGWTFRAPLGRPSAADEPAVHVSWMEARDYCAFVGGRLPTFGEWRRAAYVETRETPTDGFVQAEVYPYPVGDAPDGMNASSDDPWPQLAPAGFTKRGVNGLYDMGANVWEWLADRRGGDALTAGGSWWYGPAQTQADAAQWKEAGFYAVYIGFRCAYD